MSRRDEGRSRPHSLAQSRLKSLMAMSVPMQKVKVGRMMLTDAQFTMPIFWKCEPDTCTSMMCPLHAHGKTRGETGV